MPSGAKKRKAKKKKQQAHNQHHENKEDSGNEQEVENEHEEDPITPKTPVQTNEGEEKEKNEVEGSDAEEGGFNQNQDNHSGTSFQQVESTDSNLVVPENGGGNGLQNEVEVSSGGALQDKDDPTGDLGPLISTEEGHPEAKRDEEKESRTSSSSSSLSSLSDHVRDEEKETRTDVSIIALDLQDGDESEVSSSKLVASEENEQNQNLGPSTNTNETLSYPKDNDATKVDMEAHSEESESSDGDESKLDVVSTMATLDANESIQSVGSVDSPRSVHSQQCFDQVSNERPEFVSQDQDRGSEGSSEIPFQELGSKGDFLNAESGDKDVYNVQVEAIEFPQEEECHDNSLSEESLKGLRNEENIQVATESVSDNYSIVMDELTQVVADLEQTQLPSSVSLAAAIEESEAIAKVDEDDAKESVMPLSKSESVNMRNTSALNGNISVVSSSISGEAGKKVVSTGEANGDEISTTAQANQEVVSAGESDRDGMGLINVQGTSAEPSEISDKEIASYPQNGTDEKKINLAQRESRTSWLNCCGIMDLLTAGHS